MSERDPRSSLERLDRALGSMKHAAFADSQSSERRLDAARRDAWSRIAARSERRSRYLLPRGAGFVVLAACATAAISPRARSWVVVTPRVDGRSEVRVGDAGFALLVGNEELATVTRALEGGARVVASDPGARRDERDDDGERSAAVILEELRSLSYHPLIRADDPRAAEKRAENERTVRREVGLVEELRAVAPQHPELPEHMRRRWDLMIHRLGRADDVIDEATALLAATPEGPLALAARYQRAHAETIVPERSFAERVGAVVDFLGHCSEGTSWVDDGARLLIDATDRCALTDDGAQEVLDAALGVAEPNGREHRRARVRLDLLARRGEPLVLAFDDAAGGRRIDVQRQPRPTLVACVGATDLDGEPFRRAQRLAEEEGLALVVVLQVGRYPGAPTTEEILAEAKLECPVFDEFAAKGASPFDCWSQRLGVTACPTFLRLDGGGRLVTTRPLTERVVRTR